MFTIRRFPLAHQVLIGVIGLCLLLTVPLSIALYTQAHSTARAAAGRALQTQNDLISLTLGYADENMQHDVRAALARVESALPPARLTGETVIVGGIPRPELMFGNDIRGIGNQRFLLAYKEKNPLVDVAFLLADNGSLYRGTTLLKNAAGQYRDGEVLTDEYANKVLAGDLHLGTIQRSGRHYALAVQPLRGENGKVIGALSVRVDVGESLKTLEERLSAIVLGRTGYPFIISLPSGDQKEAQFVLHPTLRSQPLGAAPESLQPFLKQTLEQRTGSAFYNWTTPDGGTEEKIGVFREIPDLHWIVVASAPMEEYTAVYDQIINWFFAGLAVTILAMVLCLWWLIHRQLKPIGQFIQALSRMGKGDLSQALATETGSRNEIDALARHINNTLEAMKKLVEAIRESSTTVTNAAANALAGVQSLTGNVNHLSSNASQVSRSIEELSAAIEQVAQASGVANERVGETADKVTYGKGVVHGVIDSIHAVKARVESSLTEVERLTEHSRKIETVVASIGAIAGQTNLLALNAAIEAARAGEVGRGFAVVADEVRKLAEQSADSADEIGKILSEITVGVSAVRTAIGAVVEETLRGAQASGHAGEALDDIESITRSLVENVNTIAESATEQATAAQSMAGQVNASAQIASDADKVTQGVSQMAASLKAEADKLNRDIGHFKV
ncbi:MAG: methyl-accepting chemotaxis protein [Azoarcus sp.]|jgi:methyl-accepting chemotaxis protein|nr:methyl-accepting chemotaxis protein [Azoarcus sp.]